mmetsp:Transcript_46314/g.122732  ORF Transcript_46314/g.122732 Transcript_46314/m.122732 type:complete len:189 (+) Transcript_46314:136-702(+)
MISQSLCARLGCKPGPLKDGHYAKLINGKAMTGSQCIRELFVKCDSLVFRISPVLVVPDGFRDIQFGNDFREVSSMMMAYNRDGATFQVGRGDVRITLQTAFEEDDGVARVGAILPLPAEQEQHFARRCGNPSCGVEFGGLKICGRCRLLHYCSKDCQTQHYPAHKVACLAAATAASAAAVATAKTAR